VPEAATVDGAERTSADAETSRGGGMSFLPLLVLLVIAGAGGAAAYFGRRVIAARRPRFDASAFVESSAWLAPVRLAELQGDGLPKRFLTIGGPDADIDFGVPGSWARLVPQIDGSTRIERACDEQIFVNGMPLILGQRLGSGQRVKIGVREFVFREERRMNQPARHARDTALDKPDPRAAA
jgi:hypothetical protein